MLRHGPVVPWTVVWWQSEDDSCLDQATRDVISALVSPVAEHKVALQELHFRDARRQQLYDDAYKCIAAAQQDHWQTAMQRMHASTQGNAYTFSAGDFVLVDARAPGALNKGLAPILLGPYMVWDITARGNIVLDLDNDTEGQATGRWVVAPSRVHPYRYTHQCYERS